MNTEENKRNTGMFPECSWKEIENANLSIQAFGKRLHKDQTVYEYLLEFLLVFTSPKNKIEEGEKNRYTGEFMFHKATDPVTYYVNPKIGLKRFIFFEQSKKDGRLSIDRENYEEIVGILKDSLRLGEEEKAQVVKVIQDSFYGFSAVLRNRSWFAQSLLPIAPELIFNESIREKKDKKRLSEMEDANETERIFQFKRHSFMARGGELYYLHILQGLQDAEQYREPLEALLYRMTHSVESLGKLGKFIQGKWEEEKEICVEKHIQQYKCDFIPEGYRRRGKYTCEELVNLPSTSINELDKMEYMGRGMMLQIFRMMYEQAQIRVQKKEIPMWVVDVSGGNKNIRKMSEQSLQEMFETITAANSKGLCYSQNLWENYMRKNSNKKKNQLNLSEYELKIMQESEESTNMLVKFLGKEIEFIIPLRGARERMTLSEDLITFLVVSLLKPMQRVTVNRFYQMLFEHYGMVIGGNPVEKYCKQRYGSQNYQVDFQENELGFLHLLKNCGYLRELSDATAIVVNPYERSEV